MGWSLVRDLKVISLKSREHRRGSFSNNNLAVDVFMEIKRTRILKYQIPNPTCYISGHAIYGKEPKGIKAFMSLVHSCR